MVPHDVPQSRYFRWMVPHCLERDRTPIHVSSCMNVTIADVKVHVISDYALLLVTYPCKNLIDISQLVAMMQRAQDSG